MTAELLYQNGFKSAEEVAAADLDALLEVDGIGPEKAAAVLQAARDSVAAETATTAEAAAPPLPESEPEALSEEG
jgi:N utilization substance protein A